MISVAVEKGLKLSRLVLQTDVKNKLDDQSHEYGGPRESGERLSPITSV